MLTAGWLVTACWIGFVVAWIGTALLPRWRPGRTSGGRRRSIGLRLLIVPAVVLSIRGAGSHALGGVHNWAAGALGVVLCAAGIGLAIWARVRLGRNWGEPMTERAEPELVIQGPYRYVRHPIYAGMLLAMIGSALAAGLFWAIILVAFGVYFVVSALVEERSMLARFPDEYGEYRRRTKRIVPFVY
ncbi:MAG TPA: isoprenylcysteine carboxylmethyltransferase family protein [Gaiellales bacterium]|nr:isoprenylcysteine carboxylmethyltransferase family protein [Gaiellales bacterium]